MPRYERPQLAEPEPAVDPQRRIVDPHHHLWDRRGSTYLSEQLLIDTRSTHNVTHTVFVECLSEYDDNVPAHLRPVGETRFVAAEAAKLRTTGRTEIAGIVGFADMTLGAAVEEVLAAHDTAGTGLFRGVRHATAWSDDPEIRVGHTNPPERLMEDNKFREGIATLGAKGYSFDAWLYFDQLHELTALARRLPDVSIVLNHLGAPLGIGRYRDRHTEVTALWKAAMIGVASCPNVSLKIGGIGMDDLFVTGWGAIDPPADSDLVVARWDNQVRWCIDTFGPSRCMFESNFPVDRQALSYSVIWNAFQKIAAVYDDAEQDEMFAGTATKVYRLETPQ
jgi:predicted TIM-barrel fold metal-dependent hydrolase